MPAAEIGRIVAESYRLYRRGQPVAVAHSVCRQHCLPAEGVKYQEIEQAVRNVMCYYMGFRRSMAGMARALEKIQFLNSQSSRLHAETLRELMRCHEAHEILTVSELAIQATMERKETGRCVYKLRDYPELNPEMAKPLLVIRTEDGPRFQWGKAPLL